MRWLHCLLHHRYKVFTQRVQVNLIAQRRAEVRDDLGCVVFAAIEATIDDPLNTMTQGLEEGSNGERRDYNGDIVILIDDSPEQVLQGKDEAKVDRSKDAGKQAINQCLVDEDVNVPETRAQDGNDKTNGNKQEGHLESGVQIP